jgi:hypothetical protein
MGEDYSAPLQFSVLHCRGYHLTSMMQEIVFEIHRAEEGGFWAKAVGHAIFTQAENLDELEAMIRDAVDCHFEPEQQQM